MKKSIRFKFIYWCSHCQERVERDEIPNEFMRQVIETLDSRRLTLDDCESVTVDICQSRISIVLKPPLKIEAAIVYE